MKKILKFFAPLALLLCLSCAAAGCTGVMGALIRYDNAKQYTAAASGEVLSVKNLEVEWVSGKVEIVYYEGASTKFSEIRSDGKTETDDYTTRYLLDQKTSTLHLKFAKSGVRNNNNHCSKTLTVQIPQNTTLNSVEVEAVSAEAVVSVNADSCEIETVSGEISCRNATYGEIEAKTVSGSVAVKDVTVARKTEIDSVSGDAVASFITLPAAVDVESVSGDITLHFPDAGFSVKFDTVSGTFYSSFNGGVKPETVTDGKLTNAGSPSCNCAVETVSGSLTLTRFSAE